MATLCLSNDLTDLKEKLGNIFIGFTFDDEPVYARELKANGAMAVLLKDDIKPNLVQTLEGTPAILHGGPFANIAQGTNSIIATKTGMSLSEYVVTEAGFASDLGAEKFFDIKCQYGKLKPKAVVVVATIRALKYHGGAKLSEMSEPDLEALVKGMENLDKHVENMRLFGFNPVVAINKLITDSEDEIAVLKKHCSKLGVKVSLMEAWEKGGEGAIELAEMVVDATTGTASKFAPIYKCSMPMVEKIKIIATKIYGADDVEYSLKARQDLEKISKLGLDGLAVCIAKTQKSLSDKPSLKGRPENFTINIREIEVASGAGFVVPIAGTIMRMPGLPSTPSAEVIDIDKDGNISGLF
jgi:formate--tetrahydrofolate ligase